MPFIKTFHVGSATAYNLSHKDSQTKVWQKTESIIESNLIPHGGQILLCFGEIDCRVHLIRQAELQQRTFEDVARDTVGSYMIYARWLRDKGFQVTCWGAIATQKGMGSEKQEFPCHGSEIERNKVTRIFNAILETECLREEIGFCSIFDQMIDEKMETLSDYISSDNCHLSQRAVPLVVEAFLERGVIQKNAEGLEVNRKG